jgi:hypothetical protein
MDQLENPVNKGIVTIWYKDEDGNPDHAKDWDVTDAQRVLNDVAQGDITLCFTPDREMYPYLLRTYYEDNIFFRDALWFNFHQDMSGLIMIIPKLWHVIGTNTIRGLLRIVNSPDNKLKSVSATADDHSVILYDSDGNIVKHDITASDGSFAFDSVAQGHYALAVDLGLVPMAAGNDSIIVTGDNEEYNVEAVSDGNSINVTVSGATRINNFPDNDRITTYPNPVKDNLYLKLNDTNSSRIIITIISADGALIKEMSTAGNELLTIPLADLSKGIYILKVKSEDMVYQTKFIKQ